VVTTLTNQPCHGSDQATHAYADQSMLDSGYRGHSLAEYAALSGLSLTTIRRKIRRGELTAVLVAGRHGPEYRIFPDGHPDQSERVPLSGEPHQVNHACAGRPDQPNQHPSLPDLSELVRLIQEQERRLEQYAGQIGYLQAKLQAAEARILELEAPKEAVREVANRPTPSEHGAKADSKRPPRRPWWRIWS
jgi:hypothetical protein